MEEDKQPLVKKSGVIWKRFFQGLALFFLLCPAALAGWLYIYAATPGPAISDRQVVVVIPKGAGLQEITVILGQGQLIDEDLRFMILARYLGLAGRLQAGEFQLDSGQKPGDLLRQLAMAKPLQHPVTIPEGLRLTEIAAIFADKGWGEQKRFLALTRDPEYIRELGLGPLTSLEGYLYPDTYYLTRDFGGERNLIGMMVRRFLKVWAELEVGAEQPLSCHELITLASVVEKETAEPAERPLIAAVFHNRLRRGMRLQSDPKVIYGIADFDGNITKKDLQTPTPYNTYQLPGLPAGPICSPGKAALQAVLKPETSDFLYFVSKNDGTHHFSKTLGEHNRAVRKYQRSH